MKKYTSAWTLACLLTLSAPIGSVYSEDLAKECDECHGTNGNSEDEKVPSIAGASAPFIKDSLEVYAREERPASKYKDKDGDEDDMVSIAKKLSAEDIDSISKHYAAQEFKVNEQSVDASLAELGKKVFYDKCDKCHSEGGSVAEDDAGILLGQWKAYLSEQFKQFDSGDREMGKKMAKQYQKLSDEDKTAVLEFLAGGKK